MGYHVISIPYEVKERTVGESKWNFFKLMKYALDGIVAYTDVPLKIPLYFGEGIGLLSAILFVITIVMDCTTQKMMGFMYITSLLLLLTSILSLFMGVMGYYLGKVHTQTKNRPIYIAREVLTYEKNGDISGSVH